MIPRRSFFGALATYSKNEQERERLYELADMKNLDEYLTYCQRPRRTIAEALQDFPNTTKNLLPEILFSVLTPIRARAFSIASSPAAHPSVIQLLVGKVELVCLFSSMLSTSSICRLTFVSGRLQGYQNG